VTIVNRGGAIPGRHAASEQEALGPYVPSFTADWLRDYPGERYRAIEGTLVFADVSGFTRLTGLLAAAGKLGAEEIAETINPLLDQLLSAASRYGAGLLKYGGGSVLLLFDGPWHVKRACSAALEMQAIVECDGHIATSRGPVRMRLSAGIHCGLLEFLLVGGRHPGAGRDRRRGDRRGADGGDRPGRPGHRQSRNRPRAVRGRVRTAAPRRRGIPAAKRPDGKPDACGRG
jgi:class 3 adenylate cyclase